MPHQFVLGTLDAVGKLQLDGTGSLLFTLTRRNVSSKSIIVPFTKVRIKCGYRRDVLSTRKKGYNIIPKGYNTIPKFYLRAKN